MADCRQSTFPQRSLQPSPRTPANRVCVRRVTTLHVQQYMLTNRVARHAAAEKHSFGGNAEVYEWEQDEISKYAYDGGPAKTAGSKTPQKSLAQKKFVPHPQM